MPDSPTIDATIGGTAANSYQELTVADSYFVERLNVNAWHDAAPDDKKRALIMATRRLNRENWYGERVSSTQNLAWPRIGAIKPDSPAGGGLGEFYGYGECYLTTEIPDLVKHAQCELALALLSGFEDDDSDTIEEFAESGGMRVKFRSTRINGALPASVTRLIAPLLAGDLMLVRG
ncbi:MAG: hypothetical protein JNK38_01185 [Acidobacteria bacterium]|nr:hypothetical protein [Acidobacteriota bacterium]